MKQIKKLICLAAALCLLLSLLPAALAAEEGSEGDARFEGKTWDQVVEEFMTEHNTDPERVTFGYYNTVTGEEHYHRGDVYMVAASMFKVPLNMLFTEKVANGEMDWDTKIRGLAYETVLEWCIINSDNQMAENLWKAAGGYRSYREQICPYMGVDKDTVEEKYWENNFFTAEQMIHCLKTLQANPDRFPRLVDTMLRAEPKNYFKLHEQKFDVAHKYGYLVSTDGQRLNLNDCAICFTDDPICIVMFTERIKQPYQVLTDYCTLMCDYAQYHTALRHEEEARLAEEAAIAQLSASGSSTAEPTTTVTRGPVSNPGSSLPADVGSGALELMAYALILAVSAIALIVVINHGRKGHVRTGWAIVSVFAVMLALLLCASAGSLGTLFAAPSGEPQQAVTGFFDALEGKDYDTAYSYLNDYRSLGLENEPENELDRELWNALRESYSYKLYGDCVQDGLSARQQVLLQYLDLTALQADLKAATDKALVQLVNTLPQDQVYDEEGEYLPEIPQQAFENALSELLERRDSYIGTAGLDLELVYTADGWRIVSDSRMINAISGGIMSGKGGEQG